MFPWRTITGAECSGYWPAGTAAFHIGADIADAVVRYVDATGDETFEREVGLELLAQTARLWCSLGHHDGRGGFRIDGVTGPDEYSALADNNIYTNLMAQHNLNAAADAAERHPDRSRSLGIDDEEMAAWRHTARTVVIPYDGSLRVHAQAEGFTRREVWDFAATSAEQYPLLLHFPYFDLYRKQVVKQADLVLAMHLRGDAFSHEEKVRNFAYYEALTVRDSSLSACTQAVMAAEVGHLDLAHDYLVEAALMDLGDLDHNTRDGLHIASLAGIWIALVAGLAGMRERHGTLSFAPGYLGASPAWPSPSRCVRRCCVSRSPLTPRPTGSTAASRCICSTTASPARFPPGAPSSGPPGQHRPPTRPPNHTVGPRDDHGPIDVDRLREQTTNGGPSRDEHPPQARSKGRGGTSDPGRARASTPS